MSKTVRNSGSHCETVQVGNYVPLPCKTYLIRAHQRMQLKGLGGQKIFMTPLAILVDTAESQAKICHKYEFENFSSNSAVIPKLHINLVFKKLATQPDPSIFSCACAKHYCIIKAMA